MKKVTMMMTAALLCAVMTGCQTATQPGRANTQTTTVKDSSALTVDNGEKLTLPSVVIPQIPAGGYDSNAFAQVQALVKLQMEGLAAVRSAGDKTVGDVFSQNMMIETGGNEANNPVATATPSTSVPVNVAWGAGAIGGGTAGGAASADSMYQAFKAWWAKQGSGSSTNAESKAAAACADGSCADTPAAACTTGNCPAK